MSALDAIIDAGWHRSHGYGDEPECDAPNGGVCSCGFTEARLAAREELAALTKRHDAAKLGEFVRKLSRAHDDWNRGERILRFLGLEPIP